MTQYGTNTFSIYSCAGVHGDDCWRLQECSMKFGSWTNDGFRLDINFYRNSSSVDTSDYVESNEWALVANPARRNIKYYSCCREPYPDLTFTIRLKRIAVFYNYILVLPCVLLSFLTLVIFWLPPESPAKMMLGLFFHSLSPCLVPFLPRLFVAASCNG